MNTLLLSCACDSTIAKMTCVCDSVLVKSCESGCRSMTVIHQDGTNWQDMWIVLFICVAIVVVALIAERTLCSWKDAVLQAKKDERDAQKTKEEEESKRKQIADCQGKLIDFLKDQVSTYDIQKKEYEKASEEYKKCLQSIVEDKDKQENSPKQELKTYLENQINKFDKQKEDYQKACETYENKLKELIGTMNNCHEG